MLARGAGVLARLDAAQRLVGERARHRELGGRIGEHPLDRLALGERLAEGAALLARSAADISSRRSAVPMQEQDTPSRPLVSDSMAILKPCADFADHRVVGHEAVLERRARRA